MPWVASTVRRRPEAVTEVPAVDVVDKLTMCFNGAIRAWQRVPFKLVKRGYETRVTLADYDNFTVWCLIPWMLCVRRGSKCSRKT